MLASLVRTVTRCPAEEWILGGLEGVVPPSRRSRTGKAETVGGLPSFHVCEVGGRTYVTQRVTATFINRSSSSLHSSIYQTLTPTID
jgi:hypothetical protein